MTYPESRLSAAPAASHAGTGACPQVSLVQSRNLGHGDYYGVELSARRRKLGPDADAGANYTYTHRNLRDPTNAAFRPTDVPTHKGFSTPSGLRSPSSHVLPSLEMASDRWTVRHAPITLLPHRRLCERRPAGRLRRAEKVRSASGPRTCSTTTTSSSTASPNTVASLLRERAGTVLNPRPGRQSSGRSAAIIQSSALPSVAASIAASTSR